MRRDTRQSIGVLYTVRLQLLQSHPPSAVIMISQFHATMVIKVKWKWWQKDDKSKHLQQNIRSSLFVLNCFFKNWIDTFYHVLMILNHIHVIIGINSLFCSLMEFNQEARKKADCHRKWGSFVRWHTFQILIITHCYVVVMYIPVV